jgi:glycosyltransferase involved in cell wall biosynthesis
MQPIAESTAKPLISVIVPVGDRHADVVEIYDEYHAGLTAAGLPWEMIFVIDGPHQDVTDGLQRLKQRGEALTIVRMTRAFGEATALMAGIERAAGSIVLTLPAYHQIEGGEIGKLISALDEADMAVAHRWPRAGGRFEAVRRQVFHALLGKVTGSRFRDLGCGARAMRRHVADEIALYGDQHRFLALLAERQGFRVVEVDARQSPKDRFDRGYRFREYAHRMLDILTVFFLVRFTKKPLRFFGMLGASTFVVGALVITWLVIERLVFGQPLAERPALLLSSLMAVLGLQLLAIGLLGELIIFTHARQIRDYQVAEVIELGGNEKNMNESKPQAASA